MNDELIELNDQIKQENFDRLAIHCEEIEKLNILEDVEIKERDFKIYFLPMFKKEIEMNKENINIFIDNIYILTKSYNRPLQIIDDKTGDKLFRLPPIALDIKDDGLLKNINFVNLINMYNTMSDSGNTMMADDTLSKLTNALSNEIKPDEKTVSSYNEDILFMYKRYNIPYEKNEDGEYKEIVKSIETEEVEFDYDD